MTMWRTYLSTGLVAIIGVSTSFGMKISDQIDGIFRPDAKEIATLSKTSGITPSLPMIAAEAEAAKNRDIYFLAGKAYEYLGDEPDLQKAREFYRKAAELGQPEATVRMAWLSAQLYEDAKSREDALNRLSGLVKQGNPAAKVSQACMLTLGFGGESRIAEGVESLRQLADHGNGAAEYIMGTTYLEGILVPKDPVKAFELLSHAADKGLPGAQLNLGLCYNYGLGVQRSPERAFGWYLKSAESGDLEAEHNIGNAYLRGTGVAPDVQRAIYWLRKSADRGNVESMATLGAAMINDTNATPEQVKEGVGLLQQASGRGNNFAKYTLSLVYLNGNSLSFDFPKAVYLLRSAAESGFPAAQYDLSRLLQFGSLDGVKADKIEAAKWCMLADAKGFPPAAQFLPALTSTMSEQDIAEAKKRAENFKSPPPGKPPAEKIQYRY